MGLENVRGIELFKDVSEPANGLGLVSYRVVYYLPTTSGPPDRVTDWFFNFQNISNGRNITKNFNGIKLFR